MKNIFVIGKEIAALIYSYSRYDIFGNGGIYISDRAMLKASITQLELQAAKRKRKRYTRLEFKKIAET